MFILKWDLNKFIFIFLKKYQLKCILFIFAQICLPKYICICIWAWKWYFSHTGFSTKKQSNKIFYKKILRECWFYKAKKKMYITWSWKVILSLYIKFYLTKKSLFLVFDSDLCPNFILNGLVWWVKRQDWIMDCQQISPYVSPHVQWSVLKNIYLQISYNSHHDLILVF